MKLTVGIPTINRADLLKESLADLSNNFSNLAQLIIVDNGDQLFDIPERLQANTIVHKAPENLGVSGSWNYIMKTAFDGGADYVLMLNDDVVLGKTQMDIMEVIADHRGAYLITATYFWSVFLVSKECYETIGGFDEKFFPAYYEDNDYAYRMLLNNTPKEQDTRLDPRVKRNSMTIKKNPMINSGFMDNKKYFVKKWGGLPGEETFTVPFTPTEKDDGTDTTI